MFMTSTPQDLAGALLTIDLNALMANWRLLAERAAPAECGAAVKGDAYGLGVAPVARGLWEAGCRSFFVARPKEGEELRTILRSATIYVLDGLFSGQAEFYARLDLRPALISHDEAREWAAFGRVYGRKLPCAVHVDTGINRLGFAPDELRALLDDSVTTRDLDITLIMSHLACADEPHHPLNRIQLARFREARALLPGMPASLANSSGIFLGADYCGDLVRPGIALYGGNPVAPAANPMQPVVSLEATVMQIRDIAAGDSVGYGATWTAQRPSRIAVLGAGYKDGVPRALGAPASGGPAQVYLAGKRCPVIGRISMDMTAIDVTDVDAERVMRGTRAEILGAHIAIDEVAAWAGTISYELLTRLGNRYARQYAKLDSERHP